MLSRLSNVLVLTALAASTAQAQDCPPNEPDCVRLYKRFDIKGDYFATGQTLTEKAGNIATKLLDENSLVVAPDAFPASAKLLTVYLYWSGSRETPDSTVEYKLDPDKPFQSIAAEKCYSDSDNRNGSISKNFYTCRADITASVAAKGAPFGTYTVKGVDAVILPGGNACKTVTECYEAANVASGNTFSSCSPAGQSLCTCDGAQGCSYGQSTVGHASFSLVFVYESGTQTRSIFIYDGMQAFIVQTVEFNLTNLMTPGTPDNSGRLSYYIVEGDNDNVVAYADQSVVPEDKKGLSLDNPGEHVTLAWGTDAAFGAPVVLESDDNPIWDDPFNGTTGAGVDIEGYSLVVPANQTRALLTVSSPHIGSVNAYPAEVCTDSGVNITCGEDHQCKCELTTDGTSDCTQHGCYDKWATDGIGVAYIIVGFDVFAPSYVDVHKELSGEKVVGGETFDGDTNHDGDSSPGEQVQFKLQATNDGNAPATHAQLIDPLPSELLFAGFGGKVDVVYVIYSGLTGSDEKTGTYPATVDGQNTMTAPLQDIAVGETVTVYFNATISTGFAWGNAGKSIFNQARFGADFIEPVFTDWSMKPGTADATEILVTLTDVEDDGFPDYLDNCPLVSNKGQEDSDGDKLGDVCDNDRDGDGVDNGADPCPDDPKYKAAGDAAQCQDQDGDGIVDANDNCPENHNVDQANLDGDALGDACDPDKDGDGLSNEDEIIHKTKDDDADTDDDGVSDGDEVHGFQPDPTNHPTTVYTSDPTKCDTDGDGLSDGLEMGIDVKYMCTGTNVAAGCFVPDTDTASTTNPSDADTDQGGVPDGREDKNGNGKLDDGELNPRDGRDDLIISGGSTMMDCQAGHGSNGNAALLLLLALGLLLIFRRRAIRAATVGVVLLAVLTAGTASAQTEVNYQPFRFAGNSKGIILTESGELESPLKWFLGLSLHYANSPVVFRSGEDGEIVDLPEGRKQPIERRLGGDLMFALGLASWFEADLYVPLILNQTGQDPITREEVPSFALGDITVAPKFRLAGGKKGGGFLTLALPVTLPSGKLTRGSLAQESTVAFRPTLAMSAGDRVNWALNVGAVIREDIDSFAVQQGMEFTFSTGFEFGLVKETSFIDIDVYGSTKFDKFFQTAADTPVEALLAYKHRFGRAYAMVGGGAGITHGRGIPDWRVFLNVSFASEKLDRDGDGIADDDDACPDDPEDVDGWQDADGCPDPDNDGDGILDAADKCPNEAEDFDNFEDVDGCPDPDNDKDGILDAADKCPNEAEDFDNFEDVDGCPDPDNDKDGILDAADRCPNVPEDFDKWQDTDGCPDADNDGDKICDPWVIQKSALAQYDAICTGSDKCPDEPENVNGYKDEDGCPDIKFTCKEFVIPEQVNFATGSAKILSSSFPLLNSVAAAITEAPEAELTEVQGHTDIRGGRVYNDKLSQRRAASVMKYLLSKGLAANRLTPKGYGLNVPLDGPGTTGREYWPRNRRVQFIVLKLDAKSKKCQK